MPIPINELKELKSQNESKIQLTMGFLFRAHIARLVGDLVYLEEMSQKIAQLIPGGVDLSSEEYQNSVEEMKGILCVVLAKSLISTWLKGNKQDGRPKKYLLYMKGLSRQLLDQTRHISRSVDIADFLPPRELQMSEEQRLKIFREDILALPGGRSKIFERIFCKSWWGIFCSI